MSKKCPQKAIIFARVSSVNQVEGHSLNAQVSRLQAYCKQNNLEVVQEFQLIESSTICDRRQFHYMLNFIKKQKTKIVLVCDSVDRLQRSFREVPVLEKLRITGKLSIHFLRENQVLDTEYSSAQLTTYQMFVMMAKAYTNSIIENAKRGIQFKLQKGEWISKAPFGYKNITLKNGKKGIAIDNDKSLIVKEIFNLYSAGKSLSDISEKFGLSKNIIYRIVNNSFYYGEMQVKGKLYIHKYDKIITKELFDKCQSIRKTAKMPRL
jgi:DNA invertase Pin-like site-specific DNA recombinase